MKKIENNFAVTGFVGKDAEIRQFTTASVARFSLAIARNEKNGEENSRVSAFINVEAWRKNENAESFDKLTKGAMLTVEGYFKPEEWSDQEGILSFCLTCCTPRQPRHLPTVEFYWLIYTYPFLLLIGAIYALF